MTVHRLVLSAMVLGGIFLTIEGVWSEVSSPLTGKLAYSRLTGGNWQIWMKNLATNVEQQLTDSPGDKRGAAWTPDGRITYHSSRHEGYLADPNQAVSVPLLQHLWPLRDVIWSPDGSRAAFARLDTELVDSANIWIADETGRMRRRLTHEPGLQYNPAWSPEGAQIVYVGGQGYGTYELYVINADGSNRRQLTNNQSHEFLPVWSPDGQYLAYSSNASGDYEIWVMRSDGTEAHQLTHSVGLDTHPTWSPDGTHIAFVTNRTGTLEIWVMQADGSQARPLEQAEGGACDPAWR